VSMSTSLWLAVLVAVTIHSASADSWAYKGSQELDWSYIGHLFDV